MSIKPVDFQVMLPKTPEVSRIHNETTQRNIAAQQSQASDLQNKAESATRQVYSQEKSQQAAIRDKQERKQGESGERKKKKDGKKEEALKENAGPGYTTSRIDIRL